jgi:hypothetical protein
VVWRDPGTVGDIRGRTANAAGPVSSEFLVSNGTSGAGSNGATFPRVAGFPDDRFVVGFLNVGLVGDSLTQNNVYFQRYDSAPAAAGSLTRANLTTAFNQL